jgi:hypothetical protein
MRRLSYPIVILWGIHAKPFGIYAILRGIHAILRDFSDFICKNLKNTAICLHNCPLCVNIISAFGGPLRFVAHERRYVTRLKNERVLGFFFKQSFKAYVSALF